MLEIHTSNAVKSSLRVKRKKKQLNIKQSFCIISENICNTVQMFREDLSVAEAHTV